MYALNRSYSLKVIELSGWVVGLAVVGWSNYRWLPWLGQRVHGKAIAVGLGFVASIGLLFLCVDGAWRIAEMLRSRQEIRFTAEPRRKQPKTLAEKLPMQQRITIAVLALLVAAGIVMSQLPQYSYK